MTITRLPPPAWATRSELGGSLSSPNVLEHHSHPFNEPGDPFVVRIECDDVLRGEAVVRSPVRCIFRPKPDTASMDMATAIRFHELQSLAIDAARTTP